MKNAHEARQIAIDNSMDIINHYLMAIEHEAENGKTHLDIKSDPIFEGVAAYFIDNGFKITYPDYEKGGRYGKIEW